MPLVENSSCNQFIDKTTENRKILFTNKKLDCGFLSDSNFSVQKVLENSSEDFFGTSHFSPILEFKKTKHAYIYNQSDYFMDANTILDLKEIKNLDIVNSENIYILPLIEDKEVEYYDILKKIGINNILLLFDTEDPFISLFNKVHEILGNNPEDFIYWYSFY